MDGQRFDGLTRALAGRMNRRNAAKFLVGGTLGAGGLAATPEVDDVAADECKAGGKACKRHAQCCSGVCLDQTSAESLQSGSGDSVLRWLLNLLFGGSGRLTGVCCEPEPASELCAGRCGAVTNRCGQTVQCSEVTCDPLTSCITTPNGSACGPCPSGYTESVAGGRQLCTDIDECAASIDDCSPNATCTNTPGSFNCTCNTGFSGDGHGPDGCLDINECAIDNGGCHPLSTCRNTVGGRTCGPCPPGYFGSGVGPSGCIDIDECATNNGDCGANRECINTPGRHTCGACLPGYTDLGRGSGPCQEDCAVDNGGCHTDAACFNSPTGRTCVCKTGYQGDGFVCTDIDECAVNHGGCDPLTTCTNTPGRFECGPCPDGYVKERTQGIEICHKTCALDNGDCGDHRQCTDTPTGAVCGNCLPGYADAGDCRDICTINNGGCNQNATCTNLFNGAVTCTCNPGYTGDGITCTEIDG